MIIQQIKQNTLKINLFIKFSASDWKHDTNFWLALSRGCMRTWEWTRYENLKVLLWFLIHEHIFPHQLLVHSGQITHILLRWGMILYPKSMTILFCLLDSTNYDSALKTNIFQSWVGTVEMQMFVFLSVCLFVTKDF